MKFKSILATFLIIITVIGYITLDYWNILPQKVYLASDFEITEYISSTDIDNDGIDDSHDIMLGAREYINSGLKYKSAYYDGGYPTDEYSVCTDVVWYAFQSAGYDLKTMVDEDIQNRLDEYDIEKPDPNIDFRRVKNLKVFFDEYAESLTTDIKEIDQWQPGDIVIFSPSHIAIVSDKRNPKGIVYIIHHSGQPVKEEDAINRGKNEVIGHYRWK